MYYGALSIGALENTLQISCHLCDLEYSFRELSIKIIYIII